VASHGEGLPFPDLPWDPVAGGYGKCRPAVLPDMSQESECYPLSVGARCFGKSAKESNMKRRKDEFFTMSFGEVVSQKSHRATRRQINLAKRKKRKGDK